MPKKSSVGVLPAYIRVQLQKNRINHPEWTLDDHLLFLKENDIDVSRSALHRWFQDNPLPTISEADSTRAKIAALEAATLIYKGDSKEELLSLADSLLGWIDSPE